MGPSEPEPQVGQCGLRVPRVTRRMGVPKGGRVPRHWSRKLTAISDPRHELSAQSCHKRRTIVGSGHCSPSRFLASSRSGLRHPSLPLEEQHGCTPQESAKFGDSRQGHASEIKTFSHRLGKLRE